MAKTRRSRATGQAENDTAQTGQGDDADVETKEANHVEKDDEQTAATAADKLNGSAAVALEKKDNLKSSLPRTAEVTNPAQKGENDAAATSKGEQSELSEQPNPKRRRIMDDGDDESDYGDDDDEDDGDDDDGADNQNVSAASNSLGNSKKQSSLEKSDRSPNDGDEAGSGKEEAPKSTRSTRNTSRLKTASLKKRPSLHDSDDDNDGDGKVPARSSTSSSPPKERPSSSRTSKAAPKEDLAQDSIPKKKVPRKAPPSENSGGGSSLLAHLSKPPPPPPPPAAVKAKPAVPKAIPAAARSLPSANQRINRTNRAKSPPRPENTSGKAPAAPPSASKPADAVTKEQKLQKYLANNPQASARTTTTQGAGNVKWHESKVMKDLNDLCSRFGESKRLELPPRNPSASRIDLSGSFLRHEQQYDFFDTNDRGEIVIPSRPPIFPEEFPKGVREHELSWWGILDPVLGDGKFRAMQPPPAQLPAPQKPPPPAANYPPPQQQRKPQPPLPPGRGGEYSYPPPHMDREPPYPPPHGREPPFPPPGRGEPPWGRGPPPPGWNDGPPPRGDRYRGDGGPYNGPPPPRGGPWDGPPGRGPPPYGRPGPPRKAGRR